MPVIPSLPTTRISQNEFKELASEVMRHVFDIHNEFGRLFDEQIYKHELPQRLPGVVLEVPVTISHRSYSKTYYLDVLVNGCGLFEFKAVENLHARHRGQTLNYLLLFNLAHGKLINLRLERVEHEFVNCQNRLLDLQNPRVIETNWNPQLEGAAPFRDELMALVKDWGTGLELSLYDEALIHFLGGDERVLRPVPVFGPKGYIADQFMRVLTPDIAFRITAFREDKGITAKLQNLKSELRKLLKHTHLKAIHWANIAQHQVRFSTLQ